MILKELFDKVSFDSLYPYLKKQEESDGFPGSLYAFREAYDLMKTLKPNKGISKKVFVEYVTDEDEPERRYLSVCPLSGDVWENELAKEIVIAENVDSPLEEIAMQCLWELTFYGFNNTEAVIEYFKNRTFDYRFEEFRTYKSVLLKLKNSIRRHQKERRTRELIAFLKKLTGARMNRSKRKREHRQDKRREYPENAYIRLNIIDELTKSEAVSKILCK